MFQLGQRFTQSAASLGAPSLAAGQMLGLPKQFSGMGGALTETSGLTYSLTPNEDLR
jgi:hypothetical protein